MRPHWLPRPILYHMAEGPLIFSSAWRALSPDSAMALGGDVDFKRLLLAAGSCR